MPQSIFVPSGATVYLAGEVKLSSGFSGAYPALVGRHVSSHLNGRHYDGSTTGGQLLLKLLLIVIGMDITKR